MSDTSYFAAGADNEPESSRLTLLESPYDPGTVETLEATGVGPGWRCLVPGAGHGSIARWLADRVEPGGKVVATDIDTRFLQSSAREGLEVRRHDLFADRLEPDGYDLTCVRYLLAHVVGRQLEAVNRLVSTVRVGGWLVLDETDPEGVASADGGPGAHRSFDAISQALSQVASQHIDMRAGRHVAALVARHPDLRVVDIDLAARMESGGSPHSRLFVETGKVVAAGLVRSGVVAQDDVDRWEQALGDPGFLYITEMRYRILAQRVDSGHREGA
jgi:SAM-dependent methyltransferase